MLAGGLLFSANFDSGNLGRVENAKVNVEYTGNPQAKNAEKGWADRTVVIYGADRRPLLRSRPDYQVQIWNNADAHGTPFQNGNRSWFHFSVKNYAPESIIRVTIMNMNRQAKLFNQGYTPVFKVTGPTITHSRWARLTEEPICETNGGQFTFTFSHRFTDQPSTATYFAFTYPWSYYECQMQLLSIEKTLIQPSLYHGDLSYAMHRPSAIYFHRELLCHSLCGHRVDLITITDYDHILLEREERFDPLLFPNKTELRPHKFSKKKRVFIITARVHPGETPGSYMFNGALEFLLRPTDKRASALRRMYVFKLIPMLNPDGVVMGHYRTDSRGVNLNRFYLQPNFIQFPSVYAAKALTVYHHTNYGQTRRYPGELTPVDFVRMNQMVNSLRNLLASSEMKAVIGNTRSSDEILLKIEKILSRPSSRSSRPVSSHSRAENRSRRSKYCISESSKKWRPANCSRRKRRRSRRPNLMNAVQSECGPLCESDDRESSNTICTKSEIVYFEGRDDVSQAAVPTAGQSVNSGDEGEEDKLWRHLRSSSREFLTHHGAVFAHSLTNRPTSCRRGFNSLPRRLFDNRTPDKDDPTNHGLTSNRRLFRKSYPRHHSVTETNNCQSKAAGLSMSERRTRTPAPAVELLRQPSPPSTSEAKRSNRIDPSDDENEPDGQTNRLDRIFLSLVASRLHGDPETRDAFLAFCQGRHLSDPSLLEVVPEESGVQCYIDLHGHCSKRGCFCYGNSLNHERQMVDNVLYPRIVAANSAFFDFSSCNFSTRNMYLKDKLKDTSKEGSGRVGIWKHTGITHCYTVEANYNSSRIINILPATHGDDRCCTPPGDLWGPMHHDVQSEASHSPPSCATFLQLESVLRPVMLTDSGNYVLTQSEKYSPAHFEEMGRGLLIGALDMWGVNPWSRLIHSPCADLLKHAAGTYRNLRTITSLGFNLNGAGGGSCIGATSSTSNLKLAPIPSRLSQSKTMNLKVLRNWARRFVVDHAIREGIELIRPKEMIISTSRLLPVTPAFISTNRRSRSLHSQNRPTDEKPRRPKYSASVAQNAFEETVRPHRDWRSSMSSATQGAGHKQTSTAPAKIETRPPAVTKEAFWRVLGCSGPDDGKLSSHGTANSNITNVERIRQQRQARPFAASMSGGGQLKRETTASNSLNRKCPGTTVSVMEAMKRIRDHYSQQGRMRCVAAASIANHGALRAVADARPSACPSSSYASSRSGRLPTTRGTVTSSRNLRRQPPPLPSRHLRDPCLVQSSKTPPPTRPSPPKQAGSRGTKKLEQKDVLGERWAEDSSFSGNTTTSTKDRLQAKEQRKLKKDRVKPTKFHKKRVTIPTLYRNAFHRSIASSNNQSSACSSMPENNCIGARSESKSQYTTATGRINNTKHIQPKHFRRSRAVTGKPMATSSLRAPWTDVAKMESVVDAAAAIALLNKLCQETTSTTTSVQ